jgi:hypothetical protein
MSGIKTELEEIKEDLKKSKGEKEFDILETKSEGAQEEPEKLEDEKPDLNIKELKPKKEEEPQPKKKKRRKKLWTIIWDFLKAVYEFIITFPLWESFLNIFGSDIVFYVYIGKNLF